MSPTEAQPPKPQRGKVIGVTIAAAIGGLLFGFDTAVINGAVAAIEQEFELSPGALGITVAITLLGCAVGAWFAGQLADVWGRKKVMVLAAVFFVASSLGSGLAVSEWDLAAWRLLGGLAIGIASVIAPAYIGEVAPAHLRGSLGSLQQLAITTGIFAALLSDAYLAAAAGNPLAELWFGLAAWRWMLLVGVIPAVVYGFLALSIPESPQFLLRNGRVDEARDVVSRVTGSPNPDERIKEIRDSFEEERRASYRDLRGPMLGLQPILWVGIGLAAFQQLVGINAIFYYSTVLWQSVGFSTSDAFLTSVITAAINVAMTFVAILFVDKVGRRKLLLSGSAGMFAGLVATAIAFSQSTGSGVNVELGAPWGAIALVGANLFVIFFAATWGPVMWVALGEIFPNKMRSLALGLAAMVNWIFNFIVTILFPPLSESIGLGYIYAGFAFFALLSFWFVKVAFPERTGKELEDRQEQVRP
ncbi:sugar porter family MFS transporter [Arthrobacter monumenti]